ncbi:MAG: transcription elongation factor [Salegentibacter sp.]
MSTNKKELYLKCLDAVNEQIEKYEEEMDMIRESMDSNDVKTDYDEDNRGQLLGDFEKNANYLNKARQMKETLTSIDQEYHSTSVDLGSLVETDQSYYYISVPLGAIQMEDGSTIMAISTEAPIYTELKGKKEGDTFTYNDRDFKVVEVS